jgi:hypothetical protein
MSTNADQTIERAKWLRQFQPSIIRNSILMAAIQLTSLVGAFTLIGTSIYIYASSGNLDARKRTQVDQYIQDFKGVLHLRSEDSRDQAYLLLIIALLLLLVWKLTRMVRMRNAYILELDEVLDGE